MENASNRAGNEHRSGTHAALLSPAAPFCFTYKFKGLKPGDLLEAEAWQKGEGALLVFSGKQPGCGEFYFAGTYKGHRDEGGWQRIITVCQLTLKCDSAEMAFYAWNPGKTNVYMDDIKLSIKKFRNKPD